MTKRKNTAFWRYGLMLSFLGFLSPLRSQTTDSLSVSSNVFFGQLDSLRLPHGYLWQNLAVPRSELALHNGNPGPEDIMTATTYWECHRAIRTARLPHGTEIPPATQWQEDAEHFSAEIPLLVTDISYHSIKDSALYKGLLSLEDSSLLDVAEAAESPYTEGRFFSFAIDRPIYTSQAHFKLRPQFYASNTGLPDSLQIDFGDGLGFRNLLPNQALSASYDNATPDYDGETALLSLRMKKNGQWHLARFKAQIGDCNASHFIPTPALVPWMNNPDQFRGGNIVAEQPLHYIEPASGNAYVYFRPNPLPGQENLFDKPVIIVEGIDFGAYDSLAAANYRAGNFGWCDLWSGDPPGKPGTNDFLDNMPDLLNQLHDEGYDIIMLDFSDGAHDIEENAFLLATLIKKINEYKTPYAEPNVVIGASMGGVISRYALAYMEQNGMDHCTRLYISLDAPHRGAYISLGAQYFIRFFGHKLDEDYRSQSAANFYRSLQKPAAQQLLLYNATLQSDAVSQVSTPRQIFDLKLQTLGYPEKLRKVAIANGSKIAADQGHAAGAKLFEFKASGPMTVSPPPLTQGAIVADLLAKMEYYGLPGDPGQVHRVFKAEFYILPGVSFSTIYGPLHVAMVNRAYNKFEIVANQPQLPALDRAPGGIRRVSNEMEEALSAAGTFPVPLKYLHNYYENQAFIPSISSLGVTSSNDWFLNIQNEQLQGTLQTPFDETYAPDENTLHVEITNGLDINGNANPGKGNNSDFAHTQMRHGAEVDQPVLTQTFNYGLPSRQIITHVEVQDGGRLHVYGNLPDGDGSGNITPASGKTQHYELGPGCTPAQLSVYNNGQVIIGDAAAGNKAHLYVKEGSTLRLKTGGKLRIEDASQLVVEDGAELIIEPGVSLELIGAQSSLTLQGKLTLKDNAILKVSGSGHLVFDQPVEWELNALGQPELPLDEYMDIGVNASLELTGTQGGYNQLLMECKKPVYFTDNDHTLAQLTLKNGHVLLHHEALLFNYGPTRLDYVEFTTAQPNTEHGGVRLFGNEGFNNITHCKFSNGYYGLLAHWVGSSSTLQVSNCEFKDNETGFRFESGRFNVQSSTFTNCGQVGFSGDALQGSSSLANNTFSGPATGAELSASNNTTVSVLRNTFTGYTTAGPSVGSTGLSLFQVNAEMECNEFNSYQTGLLLYDAVALMNDDAQNRFFNNDQGIVFTTAAANSGQATRSGLYLREGYNEFLLGSSSPNKMHISGAFPYYQSVSASLPQSDYYTGGPGNPELHANNNRFELRVTGDPNGSGFCCTYELPVSLGVIEPIGGPNTITHPIPLYLPNNLASVNRSCASGTSTPEDPLATYIDDFPSGGGRIGNDDLKDLVLGGLGKISRNGSENDDAAALDVFQGILGSNISEADAWTDVLVDHSYKLMLTALENAFLFGQFTHNGGAEGQPLHPEVAQTLALISDRLDNYPVQIFRLTLDKVMSYRNGGFYAEALALLAQDGSWATGDELLRTAYWSCVCQAEAGFFSGESGPEDFTYAMQQCRSQYAGYAYKRQRGFAGAASPASHLNRPETLDISLYPSPAENEVYLGSNLPVEGPVNLVLSDLRGQILWSRTESWNGTQHTIPIHDLASGYYTLAIHYGEHQTWLKKLMVK